MVATGRPTRPARCRNPAGLKVSEGPEGPWAAERSGRPMKPTLSALFTASFFVVAAAFAVPRPAAASNIFCAASVSAFPLDPATDRIAQEQSTSRYAIDLGVRGKKNVTASVTFIGEKNAYIVNIPNTPLQANGKKKGDWYTDAMLVRFARPAHVRYAYVDTVAVDGAATMTCPTVPMKASVPRKWAGKKLFERGAPGLDAKFQQALPPLPCGAVYRQAKMLRTGTLYGGTFGIKARSAIVTVALDSRGKLAYVKLIKSSGIPQFDQNVLASAESSTYKPATFLCTPIVSEYIFIGNYMP